MSSLACRRRSRPSVDSCPAWHLMWPSCDSRSSFFYGRNKTISPWGISFDPYIFTVAPNRTGVRADQSQLSLVSFFASAVAPLRAIVRMHVMKRRTRLVHNSFNDLLYVFLSVHHFQQEWVMVHFFIVVPGDSDTPQKWRGERVNNRIFQFWQQGM